jgi:hypothetical protein
MEGNGAVFSFTATELSWSDGCNDKGAHYAVGEGLLLIQGDISTTLVGCEGDATKDTIDAVMAALRISWRIDDRGLLHLEGGGADLTLRPLVGDPGEVTPSTTTTVATPTVEGDLAGVWEIAELRAAGDQVAVPQGEVLVEFAPDQVAWNDGCAGHSGAVTYGSASVTVSEPVEQEPACPADDGRDLINALFASDTIGASVDGDRAELTAGDRTIVLQRP